MEKSKLKPGFYWATSDNPKHDEVRADFIVRVFGESPFYKTQLIPIYESSGKPIFMFEQLLVLAEIQTLQPGTIFQKQDDNVVQEINIK